MILDTTMIEETNYDQYKKGVVSKPLNKCLITRFPPLSVCFSPLLPLWVVEEALPNVQSFQRPEVSGLDLNLLIFPIFQLTTIMIIHYFKGHVDLVVPLNSDKLIRIIKRCQGLGAVREEAAATELKGWGEGADVVVVAHSLQRAEVKV